MSMSISYETFLIFLRSTLVSVGNSYAAVAPVREAVVSRHRWMSDDEFAADLSLVQAMPGVFAFNFGAHIGRRVGGWRGSVAALLGTLLPVFVILLVVSFFFFNLREHAAVRSFLQGVRPAVVALVVLPCIRLGRSSRITLSNVWLPVMAALLVGLMGLSPVWLVLAVAFFGYLYGRYVRPADRQSP